MKKFLVAIDQGTTSTRAILFSLEGRTIHISQKEFTQHFPKDGWVEHNPNEIWITDTIRNCSGKCNEHRVRPCVRLFCESCDNHGDVVNDQLQISVGSFVDNITTFQIYDRWGTKVYELNNFLPAQSGSMYWDGRFEGQNCQSGVYVYYMEVEMIDGTKEIVKGDIALTR